MMINIGTKVATVNIAFSTSKRAASVEHKTLQYTTLSKNPHQGTKNEIETNVFTISKVLACLSKQCADQN